jgi:hypothetical protein
LRKSDKFSNDKCPGLEEFHGSSDLFKIATKALTLAPGDNYTNDGKAETYMRIVKDRYDGSLERHLGALLFDVRKGSYEKGYQLGSAKQKRGEAFNSYAQNDLPDWADGARRSGGGSGFVDHAVVATFRSNKDRPRVVRGSYQDD